MLSSLSTRQDASQAKAVGCSDVISLFGSCAPTGPGTFPLTLQDFHICCICYNFFKIFIYKINNLYEVFRKSLSVEANYGSLLLHVTHGRVWRGSHHVLLQNSDIAKLNISCNLWVTKTYHELMKINISHGSRQLTGFCGWINSKTERALNMSCLIMLLLNIVWFCHKISIVCLYYSLLFLCILVPSL